MKEKKKEVIKILKSVKVDDAVLNLVKKNKEKTYIPIGVFFEEAAIEKLQKEKK